jgi:hypothetical protein
LRLDPRTPVPYNDCMASRFDSPGQTLAVTNDWLLFNCNRHPGEQCDCRVQRSTVNRLLDVPFDPHLNSQSLAQGGVLSPLPTSPRRLADVALLGRAFARSFQSQISNLGERSECRKNLKSKMHLFAFAPSHLTLYSNPPIFSNRLPVIYGKHALFEPLFGRGGLKPPSATPAPRGAGVCAPSSRSRFCRLSPARNLVETCA